MFRPRLRLGLGSYLGPHSGWVWGINGIHTQVGLGVFDQRITLRMVASEQRLRSGSGSYLDPDSGWV